MNINERSDLDKRIINSYLNDLKAPTLIAKEYDLPLEKIRGILRNNKIGRIHTKDLTNKKFGKLTVLEIFKKDILKRTIWTCECECGRRVNVIINKLTDGRKQSCGCDTPERKQIAVSKAQTARKKILYIETGTGCNIKGYGHIRQTYFSSIINGAKIRDLPFEISIEYIDELFVKQNKKCALSGLDIYFQGRDRKQEHSTLGTASLDRIDSSKGYIHGNVQWVHKDLNRIKMGLSEDNFIRYCELVYKNSLKKRGILHGTRTYLAGNLEFSSDTTNWRKVVKDELGALGIKCFNPMEDNFVNDSAESDEFRAELIRQREFGEWDNIHKFMKTRIETDLRLIDIIDFAIFNFEFDKPTYGTTHELILAKFEKKPIFIVAKDKTKVPLWLMGLIPEKYIYSSIHEIIDTIKKIDSGEIKIDSIKWHLLKPELR